MNSTDLNSLNILEEKVKLLLQLITDLKQQNQTLKANLREHRVIEPIEQIEERQKLKEKIEGMLELLEDF